MSSAREHVRLLVADDDRLVRVMLAKALRGVGYDVVEAEDGMDAVDVASEQAIDLAVLDINMPRMNGIDAARILLQRYNVPCIFLSAYDDSEIVREAVGGGAYGYLVKPIEAQKIFPMIESALERADEFRWLQTATEQLREALRCGQEANLAMGILIERHKLTGDEAFEMLRSKSRTERREIISVAQEMVRAANRFNELTADITFEDKTRH